MKLLIGISGKRYINPGEIEFVISKIQAFIDGILEKHSTTEFTGLSSLASGADSLFANLVLKRYNQPLIAVLPFASREYERDFEGENEIQEFKDQLSVAAEVMIASETVPTNQDERERCYFDAGKIIVDKTEHVIFVWDNLPPSGKGGTAEVIGYHSARYELEKLNIVNVSPKEKDLLFNELELKYNEADRRAIDARKNHTLVWRGALLLGCLAVVMFGVNIGFNVNGGWSLFCACAELIFVGMALLFIQIAKKKKFHENYLTQRVLAEKIRLLKANYQLNNIVKVSAITSLGDNILGKVIESINNYVSQKKYRSVWFSNYLLKKLINEQKVYHDKKIKKIGKKHKYGEMFNKGIGLAVMLIIVVHLVLNFHGFFGALNNNTKEVSCEEMHNVFDFEHVLTFLSVLLPVIYAAVEGWLFFENWEITQKFSRKIFDNLNQCQDTLPRLLEAADFESCINEQNQTMQLITNIMLTDNTNWLIILEDKANYHWIF